MSIIDVIKERRSVRTFDKKKVLNDDVLEEIKDFISKLTNPYNLKIEWKILNAKENKLSSPVIVGEDYYIAGKMKKDSYAEEAFGYEFEEIVLFLTKKKIGTTLMAGTFPRNVFEKVMDLKMDEIMPCVSPIGYINSKMSIREKLMRKGVQADTRESFDSLFFNKGFNNSLSEDELVRYKDILELVRLAPSAVNKQPWRIVIDDNKFYFYKKQSLKNNGLFDVQKIDIGIAMNHLIQGLKEKNIDYELDFNNPNIPSGECEYISTIILK